MDCLCKIWNWNDAELCVKYLTEKEKQIGEVKWSSNSSGIQNISIWRGCKSDEEYSNLHGYQKMSHILRYKNIEMYTLLNFVHFLFVIHMHMWTEFLFTVMQTSGQRTEWLDHENQHNVLTKKLNVLITACCHESILTHPIITFPFYTSLPHPLCNIKQMFSHFPSSNEGFLTKTWTLSTDVAWCQYFCFRYPVSTIYSEEMLFLKHASTPLEHRRY